VNSRLLLLLAAYLFTASVTPVEIEHHLLPCFVRAVFDGAQLHPGWTVLVTGDKIAAAGPASEVTAPAETRTIDLPNDTLIPG